MQRALYGTTMLLEYHSTVYSTVYSFPRDKEAREREREKERSGRFTLLREKKEKMVSLSAKMTIEGRNHINQLYILKKNYSSIICMLFYFQNPLYYNICVDINF